MEKEKDICELKEILQQYETMTSKLRKFFGELKWLIRLYNEGRFPDEQFTLKARREGENLVLLHDTGFGLVRIGSVPLNSIVLTIRSESSMEDIDFALRQAHYKIISEQ